MQDEYGRHTVLELLVHRLVVPHFHAAPCADTAAYGSEQEQCRLRDAPLVVLGLVLVDAVDEERHDVDDEDVNEYCLSN